MTDVVALAAELMGIHSPSGDEGRAVDFVAGWLVSRGWNVTVQEVTPGRGNVWASRRGGGVTLSTHLDTVPPFVKPSLSGDRLRGRGACDAKGITAAMLAAAEALTADHEERVDLLFVIGEEKGSDGARAANHLPATSRFLINGEPTDSKLATGAKGSLRVTVRTTGRAAHSAYPQLGTSAIHPLLDLLPALRKLALPSDPVLGETTMNIGTIHAGTEANIIPDRAEAELMFRLVGEASDVRRLLEGAVKGRAELEYGSCIPAQRFHTIPGMPAAPVAFTTDIPLLDRWGTPLLFGPGSIQVAHTADEYVDVGELRDAVGAYVRLVRTLLN
ncbi:MAG TPA: M20/M25/M40 family metallo-hydrolase [Gemmatimonadaceae bacterium]|nr:M20/M25/M40 family metallo-hydrolase [Gemmatimonadaceae bacterium]